MTTATTKTLQLTFKQPTYDRLVEMKARGLPHSAYVAMLILRDIEQEKGGRS